MRASNSLQCPLYRSLYLTTDTYSLAKGVDKVVCHKGLAMTYVTKCTPNVLISFGS